MSLPNTGLTRISKLAKKCSLDSLVKIGIVKDDERGIAPQFQRDFLDRGGSLGHQRLADRRRAGVSHQPHLGMAGQHPTDRL